MRSTMKKITVILLLTAFLAPGLTQAQTWTWESATVSRDTETGFFGMVWNLLTSMFDKNGGSMDPSGAPTPVPPDPDASTTTTTGTTGETDNGGSMDPSGQP